MRALEDYKGIEEGGGWGWRQILQHNSAQHTPTPTPPASVATLICFSI